MTNEPLIDIIARQAAAHPERPAVCDKETSLTYAELDRLSTALAARLSRWGQGTAAVLVPRTCHIVAAALAALKAGQAFMPMDDAYPAERLNLMLSDSEAIALLTTAELWKLKQPDFPADRVIFLDSPDNGSATKCPRPAVDDDSPALILYTSGTTGRPKGVVHTAKSLRSIADSINHFSPLSPDDQVGIMAGFTFIASQFLIFAALASGSTVHIVDSETRQDMELLYRLITERGITAIFLPSSLAAAMAECYSLPGTTILAAGEKLRNFKPKDPGCRLFNMYGSTEGVVVLATQVKGDETAVPLGRPVGGVCTLVVDESLTPIAPGEGGELIYSGDIMARHYLHLPEQTQTKWFTDPSGIRWFRTGDRVRQDGDGNFYMLGRTDNMVKINGFRVETGEVEQQIASALNTMEDLAEKPTAIAVALRNVHGIDHLVGYYECSADIDTARLSLLIGRHLAEYMVPTLWMRLAAFPRNANGKVMRGDLPTPEIAHLHISTLYNEVELRVEEAARSVLRLNDTVNIDDNFFDLGGSSLDAMKLASQLNLQGIHTTGSKILQQKILRTIAAQASVDYERLWTAEQYNNIKQFYLGQGETLQQVLPLTPYQEDMLFRLIMHPDDRNLRNVFILQHDNPLDKAAVVRAAAEAAEAHPLLRASIVYHHGMPFQLAITDRTPPIDFTEIGTPGTPPNVGAIYSSLMQQPYDAQFCPPLHIVCIDGGTGDRYLCLLTHRILLTTSQLRACCHTLIERLSAGHPTDKSLAEWAELTAFNLAPSTQAELPPLTAPTAPEEPIRVYSPLQEGKKSVIFVHTANTGSDAYYRLADRIGSWCSFAVVEPYNLFHPQNIRHGIKAIAANYVAMVKRYQPEGPYILGGWCYGGVVAHEMACQMEAAGDKVEHLVMLDSHTFSTPRLRHIAQQMHATVGRSYFEECPLFAELRERGLLEALIRNCAQVSFDLIHHTPSVFHGPVTYFKPEQTPLGATGKNLKYWQKMMQFVAGNYENFCNRSLLQIVPTPHEHDLMMDDESLSIILPVLKPLFTQSPTD